MAADLKCVLWKRKLNLLIYYSSIFNFLNYLVWVIFWYSWATLSAFCYYVDTDSFY